MTRQMYKKERQLPLETVQKMLSECREGTLAMHGDDGYPYCLPLNYVYINDAIYMHTAKYGYKVEALQANSKVCFSVIAHSQIAPELFTTKYESLIATGHISFVENPDERQQVMEAFVDTFSPGFHEGGMKFIKAALDKTAVIKLSIAEIKGKAFRSDKW